MEEGCCHLTDIKPEASGQLSRHCSEACKSRTVSGSRRSSMISSPRSAGPPRRSMALLRGRMVKLTLLVFFIVLICIYVTYFRHPPPDVLLEMNKKKLGKQNFGANSFNKNGHHGGHNLEANSFNNNGHQVGHNLEEAGGNGILGDEEIDQILRSGEPNSREAVTGAEYWDQFLSRNNFVSIGVVYDRCDGARTQLGTVILEEDKDLGGVRSRTFVNITLDEELDGGEFHIEVKYNSKDLYDNFWDLCELEHDLPEQNKTFTCPISPGKYSKQKIKHIPGYLPAGRYQTKAWATNEENKVIACGFSDFQL